jgi:hypothetical protein
LASVVAVEVGCRAFNFNPFHRDLNRGDQRMVWNGLPNWQAIVAGR